MTQISELVGSGKILILSAPFLSQINFNAVGPC
jgi:hypothetical protein